MDSRGENAENCPDEGLNGRTPDRESLLVEFQSLKTEIQNRSQDQRQLVALVYVFSGTLLTLGVSHSRGHIIHMLLPLFLVFMAIGWANHDKIIKTIGWYIRHRIEPKTDGLGWEEFIGCLDTRGHPSFGGILLSIHIRGTFLLMPLVRRMVQRLATAHDAARLTPR